LNGITPTNELKKFTDGGFGVSALHMALRDTKDRRAFFLKISNNESSKFLRIVPATGIA